MVITETDCAPDRIALLHSMFQVTLNDSVPRNRVPCLSSFLRHLGIYMDPSAYQYDRTPKLVPVSLYPADPTRRSPRRVANIGDCYARRLHDMRLEAHDEYLSIHSEFSDEALRRIVNNIFYAEYNRLGGPAIFQDYDDIVHVIATHQIIGKVQEEVKKLMEYLNGVAAGHEGFLPTGIFRDIVRACEHEGHFWIVQALQRASGLDLVGLYGMV